MPQHVLGLSAYYHDSAACLVRDGEIVAAAQEERFTRVKHDRDFPKNAVDYCLSEAGISCGQLELVVYYDKPLFTFDRLLETYLTFSPRGFRSFSAANTPATSASASTTSRTRLPPSIPRLLRAPRC